MLFLQWFKHPLAKVLFEIGWSMYMHVYVLEKDEKADTTLVCIKHEATASTSATCVICSDIV